MDLEQAGILGLDSASDQNMAGINQTSCQSRAKILALY